MSNLNDNLKKTIDDLDLDRRLEQLSQFAQKTVADVKAQAGSLAHDNRDKVDEWVSKATAKLDERTDGKYHDKAVKFGAALGSAVDKVADQRPAGSASPRPPPTTSRHRPRPRHPSPRIRMALPTLAFPTRQPMAAHRHRPGGRTRRSWTRPPRRRGTTSNPTPATGAEHDVCRVVTAEMTTRHTP
jgi:hypothetical protein